MRLLRSWAYSSGERLLTGEPRCAESRITIDPPPFVPPSALVLFHLPLSSPFFFALHLLDVVYRNETLQVRLCEVLFEALRTTRG